MTNETVHRRIYPILLLLFTISAPLAFAEEVIVIKSRDIAPYRKALAGFKSGFKGSVDEYILGNDNDNRRTLLSILERRQNTFIFALGGKALRFVEKELKEVPTVFAFVLNPDTILHGRKNQYSHIKGIGLNVSPEKTFLTLQKLRPELKKIGVIYDPTKTGDLIDRAQKAADKLGITLVATTIFEKNKAISAIKEMEGKVDALWMVPDTTVITRESIKYFLLFSFRKSIPLIGISDKYVKKGALFSLSFDSEDMGRQAGEIAYAITRGKRITVYPEIIQPGNFKLSINLHTAEKLKIPVPEVILNAAHKIHP